MKKTTLFSYAKTGGDGKRVYLMWALYTSTGMLSHGLLAKNTGKYDTPAHTEIKLLFKLLKEWEGRKPDMYKHESPVYYIDRTLCTKRQTLPLRFNREQFIELLDDFNYRRVRALGQVDQILMSAMDRIAEEMFGKKRHDVVDYLWDMAANHISGSFRDKYKYTTEGRVYTPTEHARLTTRLAMGNSKVYAFVRYGSLGSMISFVTNNREYIAREYIKEQQFMNPEEPKFKRLYNYLKKVNYTPNLIPARYITGVLKIKYNIYLDILRLTDNGRYPYFRIEEAPFTS